MDHYPTYKVISLRLEHYIATNRLLLRNDDGSFQGYIMTNDINRNYWGLNTNNVR
jgi:hypothetical protein